ncbi:MAG: hypothetical protein GQ523_09255 [Methanophagales archaeon]|nr:hypothetical protein [Methanophagales archaeon]
MQKLKADNKTMDAIKQIVRVSKDREIRIKVPRYIPENAIAEVILIIRKKPDSFRELPVNNLPILIIIIDTDFTDLHRCYCPEKIIKFLRVE